MPAYPIGVHKDQQYVLEQEAERRGCTIKDLIKESFKRNLEILRGGVGSRHRRRW